MPANLSSADSERFRILLEQGDDAVFVFDVPGGCIVDVNDAACLLARCSRDSLLGAPIQDLVRSEESERIRRFLADGRRGAGIHARMEVGFRARSGEILPVEVTLRTAGFRDALYAAAVVRDCSERRRMIEALRESEEQFRDITERSLAIIVIHQDRKIVYSNPQIAAVLGYRPEEMLGRDPMEFVHPEDRPEATARANARQAGQDVPERHEWRFVAKDGRVVWADVLASRTPFRNGRAILVIAVDITERKRAEEQARRHQAELAHVTRLGTMGEMAAGLAHELNQPLGAIANYAGACVEMVRSSGGQNAPLLRSLEQICAEAVRAGDIIRQLRKFVRKGEPRRTAVRLNDLVREVARFVEAEARHQEVVVQLDLADDLPITRVDVVQIMQVILNLVRNGFEAMEGCTVDGRQLVIVTSAVDDGTLQVAVADRGREPSEEVRKRMFDAFFTTKPDGLGMGLSIGRSIIEAHGGRLWATSNPRGGTVFRFTLPVVAASGEQSESVGQREAIP